MLMLTPLVSSAGSPNDNEVGAYILALNTMSPIMAKYTVYYKEAVEQSCNANLTVAQTQLALPMLFRLWLAERR
ncbi:hypothetical protein [Photorhabdus sp. RM71S]|uniref:hypothetical protein n=1 Tax=Photorhabdus sp. RM71S TaxID=3342824 RepID=UPI0036D96F74